MKRRAPGLAAATALGFAERLALRGQYHAANRLATLCCELAGQQVAAWQIRSASLVSLERWAEAVPVLQRLISLQPLASHCADLAYALTQTGQPERALAALDRALAADGDHAVARSNRGALRRELGDLKGALADLDRAIELTPAEAPARCNRAAVLLELGRARAALVDADHGVRLAPELAAARLNRASVLLRLGEARRALSDLDLCLTWTPDHVGALASRGSARRLLGDLRGARSDLRRALEVDPGSEEARFNLAVVELLEGDWGRGWAGYQTRPAMRRPPKLPSPCWRGEPLEGRRLLLVGEQGLGDSLQFCRLALRLRDAGERVALWLPGRLRAVLAETFEGIEIANGAEPPPAHDMQAALLSLPHLMGLAEPAAWAGGDAYVGADAERRARWRARLSAMADPRRPRQIGLCWRGNPNHQHDALRSLPVEALAPLAECDDVQWINLQLGDPPAASGLSLVQLGDGLDADAPFVDTVAVMAELEAVVTVDTSLAHLAGASGVACYVLLAASPDWRWGLTEAQTPWYDSMQLVRQRALGDWPDAVRELMGLLRRGPGSS